MNKSIKTLMEKDKRIALIDDEREFNDGYWVYLKDGFSFDNDSHVFSERTIKDIKRSLTRVYPCECIQCKKALQKINP